MNIDKTKLVRYISLVVFALGLVNMVFTHYGVTLISDTELDFWAKIISIVSGAIFGYTIDADSIKSLFKGKSGI